MIWEDFRGAVMMILAVLGTAGTFAGIGFMLAADSVAYRDEPTRCTLPAAVPQVGQLAGAELYVAAIDVSASTRSAVLRAWYRASAEAVAQQAAAKRGVFVLTTFTASSALVFAVSLEPHTGDVVADQGAINLARCQADLAIQTYLGNPPGPRPRASTGSDQVGAIVGVVELAQPWVQARKPVKLVLVTDGYVSPSPTGPNRRLLDLQALLDRGMTPLAIFRKYRSQILVTNARGINIEMRGIDRRGNSRASNTQRAAEVIAFWKIVLPALNARSYTVVTALP